ncbi:hypothetical protein ES705_21006 [subsurface metagenome]
MIIDIHNHLGVRPGAKQTPEELLEKMNKAGVDKCVIFPQTRTYPNDVVLKATKDYPDKFIGMIMVNPWHGDTKDKLREGFEAGFTGLKLHPYVDSFPLDYHELLDPIFKICEEYNAPIICHGSGDNPYSMPQQFEEMAKTFPNVVLIMAHMGRVWAVDAAIRIASRNKNIYLGTSSTNTSNIEKAVEEAGAEKILMGTDSPFNRHELEIQKMKLAIKNPNDLKKVLGENASKIFLKK